MDDTQAHGIQETLHVIFLSKKLNLPWSPIPRETYRYASSFYNTHPMRLSSSMQKAGNNAAY
jgi:hypothetical protein